MRAEGIIKEDPTENLSYPKVGRPRPRTLRVDEVEKLLEAPKRKSGPEGVRDMALLRLLYATGMRASELMALNTDDVDLASGYVRVRGKKGHERQLPLDARTVEQIDVYQTQARPFLTRHTPDNMALFVNFRGERLTRQGSWLIFKEYAREIGLPDTVTPHTLRHSFALHLMRNGAKAQDVQELLGHASIATTRHMYSPLIGSGRTG